MRSCWQTRCRRCLGTGPQISEDASIRLADCWTDVGSFTRDAGKDTEKWLVASAIAPGVDGANGTYVEESMLRENRDCLLSKMVEHRTCARSSVVCCSVSSQVREPHCLHECVCKMCTSRMRRGALGRPRNTLLKIPQSGVAKIKHARSHLFPLLFYRRGPAEVVAVFVFMRAWKEQDNFERSSDLTRLGWFFNTMGPFMPYLLVPLAFFFRVDYFQRDVCLGSMPRCKGWVLCGRRLSCRCNVFIQRYHHICLCLSTTAHFESLAANMSNRMSRF